MRDDKIVLIIEKPQATGDITVVEEPSASEEEKVTWLVEPGLLELEHPCLRDPCRLVVSLEVLEANTLCRQDGDL